MPTDDPDLLRDLVQWASTYADLTSGYLHVRVEEISMLADCFRGLIEARRDTSSSDLISTFIEEEMSCWTGMGTLGVPYM